MIVNSDLIPPPILKVIEHNIPFFNWICPTCDEVNKTPEVIRYDDKTTLIKCRHCGGAEMIADK